MATRPEDVPVRGKRGLLDTLRGLSEAGLTVGTGLVDLAGL